MINMAFLWFDLDFSDSTIPFSHYSLYYICHDYNIIHFLGCECTVQRKIHTHTTRAALYSHACCSLVGWLRTRMLIKRIWCLSHMRMNGMCINNTNNNIIVYYMCVCVRMIGEMSACRFVFLSFSLFLSLCMYFRVCLCRRRISAT